MINSSEQELSENNSDILQCSSTSNLYTCIGCPWFYPSVRVEEIKITSWLDEMALVFLFVCLFVLGFFWPWDYTVVACACWHNKTTK